MITLLAYAHMIPGAESKAAASYGEAIHQAMEAASRLAFAGESRTEGEALAAGSV